MLVEEGNFVFWGPSFSLSTGGSGKDPIGLGRKWTWTLGFPMIWSIFSSRLQSSSSFISRSSGSSEPLTFPALIESWLLLGNNLHFCLLWLSGKPNHLTAKI